MSTAGEGRAGDVVRRTILVVEDNPDLLTILCELLSLRYRVVTARMGEEAVEQARRERPDLVIMDMQLPAMDGMEAGRWIKRDLAPAHVPILALTARAQAGDPEVVLRSGCCDAYMAKPATLQDIQHKVDALLDARPATA